MIEISEDAGIAVLTLQHGKANALDRGWIDEIAEPENLLDDARAVARELAGLSPSAFTQTKRQIRAEVSALWLAAQPRALEPRRAHARIRAFPKASSGYAATTKRSAQASSPQSFIDYAGRR